MERGDSVIRWVSVDVGMAGGVKFINKNPSKERLVCHRVDVGGARGVDVEL